MESVYQAGHRQFSVRVGTDNRLVVWNLRPLGLTCSKFENLCDLVGITINKNAVSGNASAQVSGDIRLGTSASTSHDMLEADMRIVADFLLRTVQLTCPCFPKGSWQ